MAYDIRHEQVSSRPLAVVRRQATIPELPKVVPEACGIVWNILKAKTIKGAGRHIALYWDDQINLEVGVEMDSPIADQDPLFASATPAGMVATTVHFGPYQRLPDAHNAIHQWCATHNHPLPGPSWEIYDHWQDAWNTNPAAIRTDIYYLLKA
jgi:effector-binding domain-containing protein